MKYDNYFGHEGRGIGLGNLCTPMTPIVAITDAIEDSRTAEELVERLGKLKLDCGMVFKIDRVTDEYVRLVSVDSSGNRSWLKCLF